MTQAMIAAHIGIQQLYARYCFGFDGRDEDLFLSCFVEDGVFAVGEREFVGHEALRPIVALPGDRPRHHTLNHWVNEVNGDSAISSAYFLTVDLATGENSGYGHYDDEVVCDDHGDWRFVRRQVYFHWQSEAYKARTATITDPT